VGASSLSSWGAGPLLERGDLQVWGRVPQTGIAAAVVVLEWRVMGYEQSQAAVPVACLAPTGAIAL
jgi:hypothetical protein